MADPEYSLFAHSSKFLKLTICGESPVFRRNHRAWRAGGITVEGNASNLAELIPQRHHHASLNGLSPVDVLRSAGDKCARLSMVTAYGCTIPASEHCGHRWWSPMGSDAGLAHTACVHFSISKLP